jgi:LPS O-antigen subunit length determinant protein (WzzB/FepE family)
VGSKGIPPKILNRISIDPFIVQLLPLLEYDGERCKLYSHIKGYISYFFSLFSIWNYTGLYSEKNQIFCEKDIRKYKKFLKKMETVLKKIFINATFIKHFMYI